MILDKITEANDIKKIDKKDYDALAQEIRQFLIEKISVTGGHLASNLGAVELTMALHLVLNLPEDKLIWDVGHQAYTHKLLSGRKCGFETLRQFHGMSGFPKRKESVFDAFDTGHSSTSVSAGLGLVKARDLKGEKHTVVAVIGDGSLTGGMAYEALNNAAQLDTNYIIILNDNNMSISENVGGVSKYLNKIRTDSSYLGLKADVCSALNNLKCGEGLVKGIRRVKSSFKQLVIPGMFFEDMGITYLGPVDGHNINALCKVIGEAKRVNGPVLIHVMTKKGQGYGPAEKYPSRFHGTEAFVIETGSPVKNKTAASYTEVFAEALCELGRQDEKITAITAAMPEGTGLQQFHNCFPERFFDVGIAEEHAVTFAAGLAAGGLKPVVAIYSSFLQRAFDQMVHDVCIQNLPVVFAVDRAGLVGSDGETHQGILDLSYLTSIPNMHVCAPKNKWELADMLKFAVEFCKPIAIRYPRGTAYGGLEAFREPIRVGKAEWIYREKDIALFAVGSMVQTAEEVRNVLKKKGFSVSLINARFVKPVDEESVLEACKDHKLLVSLEENVKNGGFGEKILQCFNEQNKDKTIQCMQICIPDSYIEHGSVDLLKQEIGLDAESITECICRKIESECN